MQLQKETLTVLKNFAGINANLWIPRGNVIRTMTDGKTILAEATIPDSFDMDVGIYDLGQFLGVLGLFDQPTIELEETHFTVSSLDGRSRTRYIYANREILTTPDKSISLDPEGAIEITLPADEFKRVLRGASVLQNQRVVFRSSPGNENVELATTNADTDSSNEFSTIIDKTDEGADFELYFKIENLKMLETEYVVRLFPRKIAQFNCQSGRRIHHLLGASGEGVYR